MRSSDIESRRGVRLSAAAAAGARGYTRAACGCCRVPPKELTAQSPLLDLLTPTVDEKAAAALKRICLEQHQQPGSPAAAIAGLQASDRVARVLVPHRIFKCR